MIPTELAGLANSQLQYSGHVIDRIDKDIFIYGNYTSSNSDTRTQRGEFGIMKRSKYSIIILGLTLLGLSACSTVPEQLSGDYSDITPATTQDSDLRTRVRWGGEILETRPEEDHTCFEILAKPLGYSMRPGNDDQTEGRFVACRPGFYDPEVFKKGREVTVTGEIIHIDVRKVGEFDYQFPVVDIDFISLWPERIEVNRYGSYGPYQPFYWSYPYVGFYYRYPN